MRSQATARAFPSSWFDHGIVPWLILIVYTIQPGSENAAEIPGFVYGIIVALFLFFNTFAFNQAFQYKKIGPWKNYLYGEATYITLSLVAKSVLAWQVFSGAIIPAIAAPKGIEQRLNSCDFSAWYQLGLPLI